MPLAHFRCRFCDYTVQGDYYGQWETTFPACWKCGLRRGGMDALEGKVRFDHNGTAIPPRHDARYASSRFGEGTEKLRYLPPQATRHPYDRDRYDPIVRAVFRCRECGKDFDGRYDGQWDTSFPVCNTDRCFKTGGRVDCLDYIEGRLRRDQPYLSSRFGPGSEVLRRYPELIDVTRARDRSRSLSPRRERESSTYRHREHDRREERLSPPYRSGSREPKEERESSSYRSGRYDRREDRESSSYRSGQYERRVEGRTSPHRTGRSERRERRESLPYRSGQHDVRVKEEVSSHGHGRHDTPMAEPRRPSSYDQAPPRDHSAYPSGPRKDFGHESARSPAPLVPSIEVHRSDLGGQHRAPYDPKSGLEADFNSKMELMEVLGQRSIGDGQIGDSNRFAGNLSGSPNLSLQGGPTRGQRPGADRKGKGKMRPIHPTPAVINADHYCLLCHMSGHRLQQCPAPNRKTEVRKEQKLEDMVPNMSSWPVSASRPTTVGGLIAIVAMCEIGSDLEVPYIVERDGLLAELYNDMCTYPQALNHEMWYLFMSAINKTAEKCFRGLMSIPRGGLRDATARYRKFNEGFGTFVKRVYGTRGGVSVTSQDADMAKHALDKVRYKFENTLQGLVGQMQEYLESSPDILDLAVEDREWMLKAFAVLLDLQPHFKRNQLYIARIGLPKMEDVVKTVGLWPQRLDTEDAMEEDPREMNQEKPIQQQPQTTQEPAGEAAGEKSSDTPKDVPLEDKDTEMSGDGEKVVEEQSNAAPEQAQKEPNDVDSNGGADVGDEEFNAFMDALQ